MLCPDLNNDGVPDCAHNGILDTEDANGNRLLDRYLVYGVDICTTTRALDNARCRANGMTQAPLDDSHAYYVWPEGPVADDP